MSADKTEGQVRPSGECSTFADELAAEDTARGSAAEDHVKQCLRCQAEVVAYRRMRRVMLELADHPGPCQSELEHRILTVLDEFDDAASRAPAIRAATIGGLAAAAGAIVFAARHRRVVRLAS